MIVDIVAVACCRAYQPYIYEIIETASRETKIKVVKYTYLFVGFIFVFAGLLSWLSFKYLGLLVGETYSGSANFVFWIGFGYAFHSMYYFVVVYIFYVKKTEMVAVATVSAACLHAALSYNLIQINGAMGAAQATIVSLFVTALLMWILSARVFPMPWLDGFLSCPGLFCILSFVV